MRRRELAADLMGGGRGWLLATALLLTLTWMAGVALLAVSGWFITATALAGAGLLLGLDIFTPSALIRGAALLRTVARYGERVVGHEAVLRRLAALRRDTFERIAALPLAAQRALRSGEWQSRLGADIDTLDALPLRVASPVLAALSTVLAAVALVSWLAPWPAALLVLGTSVVVLVLSALAARTGRRHGQALVAGRNRERIALLDHAGGLAELHAYGRLASSEAALAADEQRQSRRLRRQEAVAGHAEQAVQALVWFAALAMLAMSLRWFGDSRVGAPVAVLLPLLVLGLNEVLSSLPGAGWRWGEALAALGRLALPRGDVADIPEAVAAQPSEAVRISGLQVGFDPARPLHAPFDLLLEPGLPLVVHGPSGCGKSALLATLAGELPALSGAVGRGPGMARPKATLLPQETVLLDASVLANLRLARRDMDEAGAGQVLRAFGLDGFAPGGVRGPRARVGEAAGNLSGGQARRLLLAWLSLREPELALLDEPFSGLDEAGMQQALEALAPWLARRCVVIATHAPQQFPAHWPRLRLG
ncbi:amino acid ABC transporter ATP-binding/permease protein [Alkalisalibacterium limincola]|uniref:ATP-binding cassette domain-containing protein n=1 Tax=Alkalisalibacterium limincola TaxID=2699169 RepID=A0A5C8KIK6_9GAMM|nr:ATP-binding cassette domain-containing protein [Alkalisalibacterium limincola]TXK59706.1 ATP-binding cassette domain-containing protein [Alkalisalibacterium limincola]